MSIHSRFRGVCLPNILDPPLPAVSILNWNCLLGWKIYPQQIQSSLPPYHTWSWIGLDHSPNLFSSLIILRPHYIWVSHLILDQCGYTYCLGLNVELSPSVRFNQYISTDLREFADLTWFWISTIVPLFAQIILTQQSVAEFSGQS